MPLSLERQLLSVLPQVQKSLHMFLLQAFPGDKKQTKSQVEGL